MIWLVVTVAFIIGVCCGYAMRLYTIEPETHDEMEQFARRQREIQRWQDEDRRLSGEFDR